MEEEELDNELRFVGLFPDLVGQMMETTLEEDDAAAAEAEVEEQDEDMENRA
jgi:hypothetical protein